MTCPSNPANSYVLSEGSTPNSISMAFTAIFAIGAGGSYAGSNFVIQINLDNFLEDLRVGFINKPRTHNPPNIFVSRDNDKNLRHLRQNYVVGYLYLSVLHDPFDSCDLHKYS